ncbi:MAG: glutamate racemase [Ruminococcus sp.]|jgi:glutamate racemase|nr:glutamate racemase [Ruminococcus sp.]
MALTTENLNIAGFPNSINLNTAIGVFDSGIGGLTCVSELRKILPCEDIIYFGDTARIPYGTRSKETVLRYAAQDIAFLKRQGVKIVIAACGTVSAVSHKGIAGEDTPFIEVVTPTARAAVAATRNRRVGVIGTSATIRSAAYAKAMRSMVSDIKVFGNACPLFVPLVENGYTDRGNNVTEILVKEYLSPIRAEGVDTLILGCTHYPVISDMISDFMGKDVRIISSGKEAANAAAAKLTQENLLSQKEEAGSLRFFVSDDTEQFITNAHAYLGELPEDFESNVTLVNIED